MILQPESISVSFLGMVIHSQLTWAIKLWITLVDAFG